MEQVRTLQVNIPFVEMIFHTPKYATLLKSLFTTRQNMEEVDEVLLNELPEKRGDSGSIIVPCQFGNIMTTRALTDSGASINIIPYSFFQKLNLPIPKPVHIKIHLVDKRIIHQLAVCEDLLIKVDKLIFSVDFIILDVEEDLKVPIIFGRPFLNTVCALLDMSESMLTLRVGDESVIFKAEQKDTQEGSREEKVSLLDLDDELLEKELAYLQESNPNQFFLSLEDTSNAKGDVEEIERLIREADYQESIRSPISALVESDAQLIPDPFENLLEENEDIEDVINIGNAHLAFLEVVMGGDEIVQEKNEGISEDENHNYPIESQMLDQEEVLTKRKRTKPRAIVSTMFEVLTFTTPDPLMNKKTSKEGMETNKHGKG
ncbi:uncharacterized protein LOC111917152 [Lactuca sativa]|uniref:uncharacterized protein LOC111917152 n=1 Tax=Lactuca sativa TaxID=4236 RepID=UPI000CD899E0|nr:uncharacterized protein LOC111917152 [Lactuca sativa]